MHYSVLLCLQGSVCEDWTTVYCCYPLALCQMIREMKKRLKTQIYTVSTVLESSWDTVCVRAYTAPIFFSSVFLAMLKDWGAVSAVRMFITRGPELHAGLDISVLSAWRLMPLTFQTDGEMEWQMGGETDEWRRGSWWLLGLCMLWFQIALSRYI